MSAKITDYNSTTPTSAVILPKALNPKISDQSSVKPRMTSVNVKFGGAVALSEDGLTMAIGLTGDPTDENGDNYSSFAGSVHIYNYENSAWVFKQKIVASGTNARQSNDFFGQSIAIHNNTMVVGAEYDSYDSNGQNYVDSAGAAYVFVKNSSGKWVQEAKLAATGTNSRGTYDGFGHSVDIYQDTIVVGAYMQNYDAAGGSNVSDAGAAYVFVRSAGTWSQQQKIIATGTPNARISDDYFGNSVSISGDTIAVTSHLQSYNAAGGGVLSNAGAVFIYTRTGSVWSIQQKIVGSGTANSRVSFDNFGSAVDVDGDTVAIGAFRQDYDAAGGTFVSNTGAVYVYTRSAGVWSYQQKLVASGLNSRAGGERFGGALSLNGNALAVAAYYSNYDENGANNLNAAGAAYVFTRAGAVWSPQQRIAAQGTNARNVSDTFGTAVALVGNHLVAGTPNHAYDSSGGNPTQNGGTVFTYYYSAGSWAQTQRIVDTFVPKSRMGSRGAEFGKSIAYSEDGVYMAVGAHKDNVDSNGDFYRTSAGSVHIFKKVNGEWIYFQKISTTSGTNERGVQDYFGSSVSIYGGTLVVGAPSQDYDENSANSLSDAGAAYIYVFNGTQFTLLQKIVGSGTNGRIASDNFGAQVSIVNDTIAVGAPYHGYDDLGGNFISDAGAVYIFQKSGSTWTQTQKLVPTGTNARVSSDNFGMSLYLTKTELYVGSPNQGYDESGGTFSDGSGAVYVFRKSGSTWSQVQKVIATGTNARIDYDAFGTSIAASDNYLLIGAPKQDYDEAGGGLMTDTGAAYLFERNSSNQWVISKKLVPSGSNARVNSDFFGDVVAVSENEILIGAQKNGYDDLGGNLLSSAGAVFRFSKNSAWNQTQKIVATGTNGRNSGDQFGNAIVIYNDFYTISAFRQGYDYEGKSYCATSGAVFNFKF